MSTNQNIGEWSAIVKNDGKTPEIVVNGTFPTNGEKPRYHLIKNEPQGINPSELLLTLIFGNLVIPNGPVSFSVHYNELITTTEQYKTVLVVDEDGRAIANIDVE